ncbi:helicase-related protein [Mobiluncus mulieris]|uniref:helicase-related protein n=1 Tax=Mobiluncus mulieris TaxID=2052 RepID=UPI000B6DA6A4|nr:helicase-related protein [Mobiluncus mulieris]PNL44027.1 helicase [Mobiluncus mulieris]
MELLNNIGTERLGDTLGKAISANAKLSIISSYFTVYAYGELKAELSKIDEVRFLFSEPTFIERMVDEKDPREFEVARRKREMGIGGSGLELKLRNSLNQRALARECAEWIRSKGVFKSAKRPGAIQPGGTYVIENPSSESHAFNGAAANFTQEGLGYEQRPDTVTFVSHFEGRKEVEGLKTMFESVWNNPAMVEEVTNQVVAQVEKLYRENPPEFVYFLTLYHLFRDFIEDDEYNGIRPGIKFEDSVVWSKLYDFQRDAVVGAIRKLEKYKGCIIADSVGLGKTYEALAVIKYYEERNNRVLVLCPKRLRENWTLWTRGNDDRNPLAEDRFSYDVLNHTDLSRYYGMSGDIDLEHLRWHNYDLLVIDESHNFRNKSTDADKKDRYTRLIEDVIKAGVRTKVLMLSATPVNNKLLDLRNQIELITEGDDEYLAHTDGIPSITQVTRVAQTRFNEWIKRDDSERTTESFVNAVNADYFKLLDVLTIARSRKHITKYYGAENGTFPTRLKPISFQTPIDTENELPPIGALNDMIAQLTFAQYQVLSYVRNDKRSDYETLYINTWGKDFESQVNRTKAVANLMRVNVLKRMESSVNSFRITLQRILDGCVELKKRLDEIGTNVGYDADESSFEFDTDDDAEEFEAGGRVRVDLHDVDALRLSQDLEFDINTLHKLLQYAETVTPERDAKLLKLREFIAHKVNNPFNPGNRKVLVFSAFADTTDYLFEHLASWLKRELDIECAEVAGSSTRTYSLKLTRTTFENILARFSPISKELPEQMRNLGEIDVIFATDCISEGQNLQDCDCLVNYDIHWNPVRIIQRFGRIDRLGSANSQIQLVNFWPNIALDDYIQLENRVKGRMILLDTSATGEENVLEYKDRDEMNDLAYRRKQLEQLQSEVLDLEDISGGISITDFAYDDFRVELQRYVKEHPGLLENSPLGLHAVTSIPDELRGEVKPGVVFCLKQTDESVNPQDTNPLFPHYLVYVSNDGEIMTRHTQPKPALDIMRAVCSGHAKPIADLCHEFNRETHDGTKMGTYTEMLNDVVSAITGIQQDKGIENLFSLGEVGSNVARGFDDYSLVCFAVIR